MFRPVLHHYRRAPLLLLLILALLLPAGLSGCSSRHTDPVTMAAGEVMPHQVRTAPGRVQIAYRFAAANPESLAQIPCYCGCGPMGHRSNYDCFWQENGSVDEHALGCGICVDIAHDVLRGLQKDPDLVRIRDQIDADYSRFGPATDTPPVAIMSD